MIMILVLMIKTELLVVMSQAFITEIAKKVALMLLILLQILKRKIKILKPKANTNSSMIKRSTTALGKSSLSLDKGHKSR